MNNKKMHHNINEFIEKSLLHSYMVLKEQIEEYLVNKKTNLHFSVQSESFFDNINNIYNIQNKSIKIKPKPEQKEKQTNMQSRRIAIQNILLKFQMFINYADDLLKYSQIVSGESFKINLNFDLHEYIDMCHNYANKYHVDINEKNINHFFTNINNPSSNYYFLRNDFLLLQNNSFNNIVSHIGSDFNIILNEFRPETYDLKENIRIDSVNRDILKNLTLLFYFSETIRSPYGELNINTFRNKLKENGNKNLEHFEHGLIKALSSYERKNILSSLNNFSELNYNEKKRL